jgi:hypothetical protein
MSLDLYLVARVDLGGPEEPHEFMVWEGNLTYNLSPMLDAAGPYWDRIGRRSEGCKAVTLLEDVKTLVTELRADTEKYCALNPSNGWGTYEGALKFLDELRAAIEAAPQAEIHLSK